jgi:hypothetical protein
MNISYMMLFLNKNAKMYDVCMLVAFVVVSFTRHRERRGKKKDTTKIFFYIIF